MACIGVQDCNSVDNHCVRSDFVLSNVNSMQYFQYYSGVTGACDMHRLVVIRSTVACVNSYHVVLIQVQKVVYA